MERPRPLHRIRQGTDKFRLNVRMTKSRIGDMEYSIFTEPSPRRDRKWRGRMVYSEIHYPSLRAVEFRTKVGAGVKIGVAAAIAGVGYASGVDLYDRINQLNATSLVYDSELQKLGLSVLYARTAASELRIGLARSRSVRLTKKAARKINSGNLADGEIADIREEFPAAGRVSKVLFNDEKK